MFLKRNCIQLSKGILIISNLAAIALIHSPTIALSPQQIKGISQSVTIQIQGEDGTWGSGTIVKRDRDTYYAITSFHVVDNPTNYTIVTPDRQRYLLDRRTVKPDIANDIAALSFTSNKNYKTAKIGNSISLKIGVPIYINGFVKDGLGLALLFRGGEIIANSIKPDKYSLIYTNNSLSGMSGGGIFNRNGELVGVQGWGEVNQFYRGAETVITGNARGIAIDRFLNLNLLDLGANIVRGKYRRQHQADDFYVSGLKHQKSRDYQRAIVAYTRALQLYPKYTYAYYKRGDCYYQQAKYSHTYRDFSRALRFGLRHPDVYNYRGLSRYKLGDYPGAIKDYTAALNLDRNYAYAYANRGDIRYSLKQYRPAIKDYTAAISNSPEPQYLYLNRGYAYYELGEIDAAIADWRESRKLLPQDRRAFLDLAIAIGLYQKGEIINGVRLAESALQKQKNLANFKTIRALGWGDRLLSDARTLFQDPEMQSAIERIQSPL